MKDTRNQICLHRGRGGDNGGDGADGSDGADGGADGNADLGPARTYPQVTRNFFCIVCLGHP